MIIGFSEVSRSAGSAMMKGERTEKSRQKETICEDGRVIRRRSRKRIMFLEEFYEVAEVF